MEQPADLRDVYNLVGDLEKVNWLLLKTQPFPTAQVDGVGDATGLDCLAVVLRLVYAYILAQKNDALVQAHRAMEKNNPFLAYAWQDFDQHGDAHPSPALTSQRALNKKRVIDTILEVVPTTTFIDLVSCNTMIGTIWSAPDFWLYRDCLVLKDGEWSQTNYRNREYLDFTDVFLRLDGSMTLQESIDDRFSVREIDGVQKLWCSSRPSFVQILHRVPETGLSFSDIRGFTMPIGDFVDNPAGGLAFDPEYERQQYNLIAIVQQKDDDNSNYVRTYMENGAMIEYVGQLGSFVNHSWRVSMARASTYYLLYRRCEDKPYAGYDEHSLSEPSEFQGDSTNCRKNCLPRFMQSSQCSLEARLWNNELHPSLPLAP